MKDVKIGLIGANWMGGFHATALQGVRTAYNDVNPVFRHVADANIETAKTAAQKFGFEKYSADWHDVVNDPEVDLVIVATPNFTHCPIVVAAAEAGKHILCEKPMANTIEEGKMMVEAVKKAGVKNMVDFTYTKCPANVMAKELMQEGKLGDFVTFRGEFDCAYCADPSTPAAWRQIAATAGTGALGDLTAHIVSLSDMIVGKEIVEVMAVFDTPYKKRPDPKDPSKMVDIDTDDQVYVMTKYEDGRIGSMSSSRISVARPVSLAYELQGSKGAVKFEMTRINELLYYSTDCDERERGYKTIKGNTKHGDYKLFCATEEQGISYAEIMSMQEHDILTAIIDGHDIKIDMEYGLYVDRVMAACELSAKEGRWVKISEIQ